MYIADACTIYADRRTKTVEVVRFHDLWDETATYSEWGGHGVKEYALVLPIPRSALRAGYT